MSINLVNSPNKAWRQVFTNSLLNKIARYSNDYGSENAKDWKDIDCSDLINFVSILFIMSVQKRKDKSTNWFSDNALLECKQAKQIMSGRKFHTIVRYLHCCPLSPPTDVPYDPAYKISEMTD